MKIQAVLPWALIVLSVVLGVLSFLLLPETVVTQISVGGSGATTMPKLFAVLLPTALGVGGALAAKFGKFEDKSKTKSLLISVVGIVVFVIMLAVNL